MQKGKTFDEMIGICEYFEKSSQDYILFKPELLASQKINSLIKEIEQITELDAINLLALHNEINNVKHYDGSGWLDYKMHLSYLLELNGFKIEWLDSELRLATLQAK